ncbi:MAG: methyltransferase domain-containing protein [Vulcanimicrobiaceae bacterium]
MTRELTEVDLAGNTQDLLACLDPVTRAAGELKIRSYVQLGIAPGARVLDVGCGAGDDLCAISRIVGSAGSVTGIDPSDVMIDAAIQRGLPDNAHVVVGSAQALPFDDSEFDAARAERVFQYLEHPETAAHELIRVLRPNGRAAIIDQDWETLAVSGSDLRLTRCMCDAFADHLPNGSAGTRNLGVLRRAGFIDTAVDAFAYSFPFPVAFASVFKSAIDFARSQGRVSHSEAARWLADLQMADELGECLCTVTVFSTVGRKPEA